MNLIISTSPLQMLIAERIIEQYPSEQFECVIISNIYNEKFDYYSERLGKLCYNLYRLSTTSLSLKKIFRFINLRKNTELFRGKEYDRVFVASIDDTIIYSILDNAVWKRLYTFDDGSINIVNSGRFYRERPAFYNILKRILNIKYSQEEIVENSICHYTIYPNRKNIIDNVSAINLFKSPYDFSGATENIAILLGQYVYASDSENWDLFIKVMSSYNIKYLFPHPKMMNLDFSDESGMEIIDTNLIFEEYIQELAKDKKIKLYTFFSSAAMNVANYPNIDVIAIVLPQVSREIMECYKILESLGAELVEL